MPINNNSIFGAFTLGEVRSGQLTGEWLNKETVANYGWFGGGSSGLPTLSTVDRIDFSNDSATASPRGPLSLVRYVLAATGNSNYGWFAGGQTPPTSTVDRIDFSNDSSTASVRGPLSSKKLFLTATGNSNYGWFGGGTSFVGTFLTVATVDRIDFSNDSSTTSSRGSLSLARNSLAATGNSNYGWFGGGVIPTPATVSTVDRIDFSNDLATASPRGSLSLARYNLSATGNSNYGWFGGGSIPTPATVSTVDRIDFSNDSPTTSVRGPLTTTRSYIAATGNSNYGWFGGAFPAISTVDRIDFSNDTRTASPRGPLSAGRYGLAATSGVLNIRRQKGGNFGWFGGGSAAAITSAVNRIDFSNDSSTASPRGPLSLARYSMGATGNANYGWWGGGLDPAVPARVTRVDRIDFSNDSPTASIRGPLSSIRNGLTATGNSNYGWFGGGGNGSVSQSIVDRINFSNDLSTASIRGSLNAPAGRSDLAATGNSNYGWFGGGEGPTGVTTVNRIDFSNDSATASPRGPLSSARYILAATGNSNYGWFGGGSNGFNFQTANLRSTIDRINFSNDSVTASVRGPLSLARYVPGATGNSNYGWFGGGAGGSPIATLATVDRIDFSNDSVTASVRTPLATAASYVAATSNTPIG
jgi:hypothetical protein